LVEGPICKKAEDNGIRPPRLPDGGPESQPPARNVAPTGRAHRREKMVRYVAQDGRGDDARETPQSERRFLFRLDLLRTGHPDGPVYTHLRLQPNIRMDRACAGAVREQPVDPPAG